MPLPRPSKPLLPPTREAARLGAFARGLGCGVGIERSCKLTTSAVETGRFLLSYGADERTARLTGRLLGELGAPEAVRAAFAAAASSAGFLHLGYEGAVAPVLKVYCEQDPATDDAPLYTAWKWSPSRPGVFAVDDYRLRGMVPAAEAALALESALEMQVLAGPCAALLARAGPEIMLLDVRRRGAERRSYDLRLYGGDLTVGDAEAVIGAAWTAFGLGGEPAAFEGQRAQPLGHLSGGRDDRGQPFVTLYYGAEDFA